MKHRGIYNIPVVADTIRGCLVSSDKADVPKEIPLNRK